MYDEKITTDFANMNMFSENIAYPVGETALWNWAKSPNSPPVEEAANKR